jgi:PPM family protein phosphatase
VLKGQAVMGHVGDSRLYLLRAARLHQVTRDHTLASELVREGALDPSQVQNCPYSHILTRALGTFESVNFDTLAFALLPGDVCLLCSDGLTAGIPGTDNLQALMSKEEPDELPARLVEEAKRNDGGDNITAVVVKVAEDVSPEEEENRREILLRLDALGQVSLFRDLALDEILRVMEQVDVESCLPGQTLVHEGAQGEKLYVILKGSFAVLRKGKQIAELLPGSHFGEMALLGSGIRSATVEAREPSRVLVLWQNSLANLIRREPDLGIKLLWALGRELSVRLETV